ncbi:MAG: hypothetical protein KY393_03380 [Actinobacteria bacterium]|nr:hypothetical protein [Actinomycetota bacterium]
MGAPGVKLRLALLGPVLLLLLASCNGNGPTDQSSPTVEPTISPGTPVGSVERVLDVLVSIEGDNAASGDPLFSGAVMQTDSRGLADFSVEVLEDCRIRQDSEVIVAPSPDTPLSVEQGRIVCVSKPGETEEFQIDAGDTEVNFLDPIFAVDVRGSSTRVQVDYGFVDVRSGLGSDTRLVGPGGEISISHGSVPESAERFETNSLERLDLEAIERMYGRLPPEPRGLPSVSDSRALSQIDSAHRLRVGLDGRASSSTRRFVEDLMGAVAERWGVDLDVVRIDGDDVEEALQGPDLQAFVSPEAVPGAPSLSLFNGDAEQGWELSVRRDRRWQRALEGALKVSLNNGEYGDAYFDAFGSVPSYEAVRSLIYPSPDEVGETRWQDEGGESRVAEVAEVDLAVDPQQYAGECPTELALTGSIEVLSPGRVEYEFRLNDNRLDDGSIDFQHYGVERLTGILPVEQSASGSVELVVRADRTLTAQSDYLVECNSTSPSPSPSPSPEDELF